jgi:hypothetical protein
MLSKPHDKFGHLSSKGSKWILFGLFIESGTSLKNVVQVNSHTSYRSNLAFCAIGYKPRDLTELI